MTNKFQTYEKVKKQASHIIRIQKLLHQVCKKRSNTWTNVQGQPQKMLQPTSPKKPTSHMPTCKEQKKLKKAQQMHRRAADREKGIEAHLFVGNPSMSSNSPTQQSTMGEIQINKPNPLIVDTTTPLIDDLCTQLDSLMLDEREEVINCLCIAQGEPYSQLVWSAWRKRSNVEGIYLSIQMSMQLHIFIHLTHK